MPRGRDMEHVGRVCSPSERGLRGVPGGGGGRVGDRADFEFSAI